MSSTMQSSSREDISVYDSKEEDEIVESAPKELSKKSVVSGNSKSENSSPTKLNFMECFAHGSSAEQTEIKNGLCADFDGSNGDHKCNDSSSYAVGSSDRDFSIQEETFQLDDIVVSTSMNNDVDAHASQDKFGPGNLIPGRLRIDSLAMGSLTLGGTPLHDKRLDCALPELPSDQEKLVDVISDDDESLESSSPPTSSSDFAENKDSMEHLTPSCSKGHMKMEHPASACCEVYMETNENINAEVIVTADFLFYGDRLSNHSRLTFSPDYIKLEDLNAYGSNGPVSCKWAVDDIVHIESQWSESVETGLVKLRLRPTGVTEIQNIHGTSDIVKLTFGVNDPQWREKEQTIVSLTARYKAIWNSMLDVVNQEDDFMGQNSMFFLKRFFANIDEPFEDVIYPKGDPDAVSISKRDVELLQPETFINDTIIDFYIKYLKNKIQPEDKHRFHFFNSFFFRKLADLDKDPGSVKEGRAAFLRVRKWTRKVNIFEKDYILIPVNFNLHWSLMVICHPGEVAYFKDEEIEKAPKVPCILHMDSIKGSHTGLKNLIQSYLWEEWKERHGESSKDLSLKFSNLRFVPLELPQQENSFDCGLFLLHYVELFLEEAPLNFSPFKITKFSNFLNADWFPPFEASHKRSVIQKLIFELLNDHSLKIPPAACSSQHGSPKFQEINAQKEQAVQFLSEQCSPTKKRGLGNSFCSTVNGGIEIELLPPSSPRSVQCDKESGIIFREFLEQGNIAGSSLDTQCGPFHRLDSFQELSTPMSPIEEDAETGEQFVFSPSNRVGYKLQAEITVEACSAPYSPNDVAAVEASCSQDMSMQPKQHEGSESMCCGSQNSIGSVAEITVEAGSNEQLEETEEKPRLVLPETFEGNPENPAAASDERLETCAVEDTQEGDAVAESKEIQDSFIPCQQNHPSPSLQDVETTENSKPLSNGGVQLSGEGLEEGLEQQAHKRLKVTPPEGEREHMQSMESNCQS
ncbi:probable ubiquitin-like-specific protease 2B isoform X2 [Magnolia sinica]|uniref:probable ubiquitin-like-specific protease 2B isoform X2 n=1 Tax=Magnolia sinica TaxID=86752 RepID=UPI0026591AD3|nr:probable ubiquitin-like-specific protease 2B isoform X2 [Magnolia sinica]